MPMRLLTPFAALTIAVTLAACDRATSATPAPTTPLSAYGHAFAAVPVVVQLSVAPLSVPLAVPLTGTPAHVAV